MTILEFPKSRIVRPPRTVDHEELDTLRANSGKKRFAMEISENISDNLEYELENFGIDVTVQQFADDFAFAREVISALIHRSLGLEHEVCTIIDDNMIEIPETVEVVEDKPEENNDIT